MTTPTLTASTLIYVENVCPECEGSGRVASATRRNIACTTCQGGGHTHEAVTLAELAQALMGMAVDDGK